MSCNLLSQILSGSQWAHDMRNWLCFEMNKELTEEAFADVVMEVLYGIPDYLSVNRNIVEPLKLNINEVRIRIVCRRLLLEGLIEECDFGPKGTLIRITKEGYKAISLFDTYTNYKKEAKKIAISEREITYLKEKNIRLKNLNLIIGVVSFIAGILLSAPIKSILKQWLVGDG